MAPVQKFDRPQAPESEQRALFEAALEDSLRAEARVGIVEHYFGIAGTVVRIVFAGDRLAKVFVPAIAHLERSATARPDATFHVWESKTTGIDMPRPQIKSDCFTDRGDIWGMNSERFKSAFHWSEFSVNFMDMETNTGIFWVNEADSLPYWTKSSPLRTLFHWWMEKNGCQLLHAAALGNENGGVLITGKGGVGKSTTALACLAAGLRYIADDYLVVQLDPVLTAHSLYCTGKLNWDQLERFPRLRDLVGNHQTPDQEKALFYLHPERADMLAKSMPIRGVFTPRIAAQDQTTIEPASKIALQRAAAFTTMSQLPHAGRRTHEFIDRLVTELPSFTLVLGRDRTRISEPLVDLLAQPDATIEAMSHWTGPTGKAARPLVSIIIPVYNGARFLSEAIGSILSQNYPEIEIIVVDDGSTDDIDDTVRKLPIDVRFFKQPNSGPAAARNRGIRDASGEFIAFLDVDDLWPAGNLGFLVDALVNAPELEVVRGYGQIMLATGPNGEFEYVGNPRENFPHYIAAALYRRAAFQKVGLFDVELLFGEDSDWFTRASEIGLAIERIDQITLLVRRHDQNMTLGKTMVELNPLRSFKKALDRRRAV